MEQDEIMKAATKMMLFTWLHGMDQNDNLHYNEENSNIIEIDSYASSRFAIGRNNDTDTPFLGIPRSLIPWFVDLDFQNAHISFKRSMLYLTTGDFENEGFTLGITIRKERMNLLWSKNNKDDDIKRLDFRIVSIKANNEMSIAESDVFHCPFTKTEDLSRIVIDERKVKVSQEDMFAEEVAAKFDKEYASKYMGFTWEEVDAKAAREKEAIAKEAKPTNTKSDSK